MLSNTGLFAADIPFRAGRAEHIFPRDNAYLLLAVGIAQRKPYHKSVKLRLWQRICSLYLSGNVLLEDVPGTGKTLLARTLARSVDCGFKRIQFTPDLLPSDITGINFYNMKEQEFVLRKGPVFTNILLADERLPPPCSFRPRAVPR